MVYLSGFSKKKKRILYVQFPPSPAPKKFYLELQYGKQKVAAVLNTFPVSLSWVVAVVGAVHQEAGLEAPSAEPRTPYESHWKSLLQGGY